MSWTTLKIYPQLREDELDYYFTLFVLNRKNKTRVKLMENVVEVSDILFDEKVKRKGMIEIKSSLPKLAYRGKKLVLSSSIKLK